MWKSMLRHKFSIHVLAWTLFIFYEVSIALILNPTETRWWGYIGYYMLNIFLFYGHAHGVLAPIGKLKSPVYWLVLMVPAELCLYIVGEYNLEQFYDLFREVPGMARLDQNFILRFLWRGSYFVGLSTAYWFVRRSIENNRLISQLELMRVEGEREKAELEKDLIKSKNAYLQAQINPHLLFNTLNFLYNAVEETSPKASKGILLLSEVMHYALGQVQEDGRVELTKEVGHIQKYVALNQLRFSYPLYLSLQFEGALKQVKFPPLVLLTFLENIYKHGDLTDPAYPASFQLCCDGKQLRLQVKNKKRKSHAGVGDGIGLQNVRTRLESFYKEKYSLMVAEDEIYYKTDLTVKNL